MESPCDGISRTFSRVFFRAFSHEKARRRWRDEGEPKEHQPFTNQGSSYQDTSNRIQCYLREHLGRWLSQKELMEF